MPMPLASRWNFVCSVLTLLGTCLGAPARASTDETGTTAAGTTEVGTTEAMAKCVAELNSDHFDVRRHGAEALQALAQQPSAQAALAIELERLLLAPDTPYEVRALCEPILSRLPPPAEENSPPIALEEIYSLMQDVDAASYGQRMGAALRLQWIAKRNPQWAATVAEKLKQRLQDPQLTSDTRRRLAEVREAAWVRWLASDPANWAAPTATEKQVETWLQTLISTTASAVEQESADRELTDLVVYEAWAPKLRTAVEKLLQSPDLSSEAIERLTRLSDLSRPAMVAEIWHERTNNTLQYLLVDVPQYPEGALRATHFNRIDDTTAHCVSGNSLAPGDYPVGVAIPITHPEADYSEVRMFQLMNLPNARRRLLYDLVQLKLSPEQRLHELSERTTAWMTAQKRCLSEREIALLRHLDGAIVSRFAGPYLLSIDDQPKTEAELAQFAGSASRHTLLCAVLVEIGTHEVLPSLVEAARRDRLPVPTEEPAPRNGPLDDNRRDVPPGLRYHFGWLAAFAIAERDPWPGLDEWLAGILDVSQPISKLPDPPPEVGATAAAMLLTRHGENTADFGVAEVADQDLRGWGIPASRFTTPAARQQVREWWQKRQTQPKAPGA
jgi:hypothetical protein